MSNEFESEEYEEDVIEVIECPVCGGQGFPLGSLGIKTWCRCQNCGMEFAA